MKTKLLRACKFCCAGLLLQVSLVGMAADFALLDGDELIGRIDRTSTLYEDTLVDVARANRLGFEEIRLANPGVDTWIPGEGTEVLLPTQFILPRSGRDGVVINLAEYRMYYFFQNTEGSWVRTFPISIGRMDWQTPLGNTRIVTKARDPSWYPPASIRREWAADGRELGTRVPPGPDNPLGQYAIRLDIPGYLIHGTNRPAGVGMRVTHGCIRMFPEDIEWVFSKVPIGTNVEIVNQPFKIGWSANELFLEVHPPLEEGGASEESAEGDIVMQSEVQPAVADSRWSETQIIRLITVATHNRAAQIDWDLVSRVYAERLGVPVRIGSAADDAVDQLEVRTDLTNSQFAGQ